MSSPRVDPRDRRDKRVHFNTTPEVKTDIKDAARRAGMSASGWMSAVLLAAAGWHDTARRSARRRPNVKERDMTTGAAPVAVAVSAREKAAIEKKADKARMDVSAWATAAITEALEAAKEKQP